MGFDIKSFIQDVQRAMGNHPDVKVDDNFSEGEKKALPSIFGAKSMVENAVAKGDLSAADAKAIFGLEISDAQVAKAPRRAGEGDGGEGGGTTNPINIDVTIPININITIPMNMSMDVQGAGIDVDALVEILKKYLDESQTNQTNVLMAFIQELWNSFSAILGDGLKDLLEQILKRFDEQDKTIERMYEQLMQNISNSLESVLNELERLGVNISNLESLVKNLHREEMDVLLEIYSKLATLHNAISDLSEEQRNSFTNVLNKLGDMELSLSNINSLLAVIQADTTENKKISLEILEQIEQGKTEILTAIANLGDNITTYGDKILNILENIDIDKIGQKLDDIKALLEVIDTTTKDTNKDTKQIKEDTAAILELLKDFPDFVSTIKDLLVKMDGKLDKIREFLEQMEANNVERHTEVMNMLQQILDKDIKVDFTEVLTAIADLSAQSADQYEGLSNQSKSEFEALKELIEKIPGPGPGPGGCNCKDYTAMLEEILTAIADLSSQVGDFKTDVDNSINNLMQAITNLTDYTQNIKGAVVDLSGKLDEILGAIKDHHVTVTLTHDEADPDKIKWTYVDCLHQTEEQQAAGARRASGFATTPEQAREYEMLLNFGTTKLSPEQEAKFKEAQAHRPKVSGDTSGIEGVETEQKQSRPGVYTLSGTYVGADRSSINRPGIYIIDGKKVTIK